MTDIHYLARRHETASYRIAYRQRNPAAPSDQARHDSRPGVLWLGGFKSDMAGSKAEKLDEWATASGRCFTRFDYFGHGLSDGDFTDGTLSRWYADALAMLKEATHGPQILVGSSMGAWIACLLAHRLATAQPKSASFEQALKDPGSMKNDNRPVAGLVLIAPALDFTEVLMWDMMSIEAQRTLMATGRYDKPSDYSDEPYIITRALIEDGRQNLLLDKAIQTNCRVHILQGQQDRDVPWPHALRIAEQIAHDDLILSFVKMGDHRLSRDIDLARMIEAVEAIA